MPILDDDPSDHGAHLGGGVTCTQPHRADVLEPLMIGKTIAGIEWGSRLEGTLTRLDFSDGTHIDLSGAGSIDDYDVWAGVKSGRATA